MQRTLQLCLLVLIAPLAACVAIPDVEFPASRVPVSQDFPAILPLAALVSQDVRAMPMPDAPPEARIAALQARAALLRRPVLTDAERARILAGMQG